MMNNFVTKIDDLKNSNFKNRVRVYLEKLDEDKFLMTDDEDLMDWYYSLGTDEAEKESLRLSLKRVVEEQKSFISYLKEMYSESSLLSQANHDLEELEKLTIDNYKEFRESELGL